MHENEYFSVFYSTLLSSSEAPHTELHWTVLCQSAGVIPGHSAEYDVLL